MSHTVDPRDLHSFPTRRSSDLFECHPRCLERLRGPAQVARDECDLGLGDHAPRAGHRLFRTERTRSTSQESLCPNEIAERSEEHTSELQSQFHLVCRLLLEKKK